VLKGKVEILQLPVPVLRDLKKLAAEVVREESEKSLMARKAHVPFTKFQPLVGPWDHVAEGAYSSSRGEEGSVMAERRRFIATASGVMVAAAAATVVDAPNAIAQPKYKWRMPTT